MSLLGVSTLVCPLHSSSSVLRITCGTCEYVPATTTVEPTMLNARNARQISYNVPIGWPGGAGFEMDVFVEPDHVSFQQLSFMEDVSSGDTIDGYFTNVVFSAVWHHSEDRGALVWHNIQGENFFFHDLATMGDTLIRPWAHGTIVWRIPIRWRDKNETATPVLTLSPSINQTFTMSDSGCLRAANTITGSRETQMEPNTGRKGCNLHEKNSFSCHCRNVSFLNVTCLLQSSGRRQGAKPCSLPGEDLLLAQDCSRKPPKVHK